MRRDWESYLAQQGPLIALLALLAAAFAMADRPCNCDASDVGGKTGQHQPGTHHPGVAPPSANPSRPVITEKDKPRAHNPEDPCRASNDRGEQDSCSQRRSAVAAEESARLNWHQVLVAYLGSALAFFAAGFTGWAALAASRASRAAQRSIEVSEQSAQRQLRAYVLAVNAEVARESGVDSHTCARVLVRNSGQTPAYECDVWCIMAFAPYPRFAPFDPWLGKQNHLTAMGPGDKTTSFATLGRRLTDEEALAIQTGTAAIWLYGSITYADAFGASHKTMFRFIFGGPNGVRQDGGMGIDAEGNEAD